jgi:succinate dehydrogenase / fumarate reductase cytochrome b subunit
MAVSGLLLFLFAIVHMVGHLQMFGGPDMYNTYANFLQNLWEVKWPVRIGLLVLLIVHLFTGISLSMRNRAARPERYAMWKPVTSSVAGRTMAWTGMVLFAFLSFHILHFTVGIVQPEYFHLPAAKGVDAYAMFVYGFRNVGIYAVYLAGMILLALHLGHGATSWLQSLGLRHPKYPFDKLGPAISAFLFVGYMLPPTAVLLGIIKLS